MKKIFSLFAAVLMAASVMGYTLPSSTMDLKTITASTMGTWADQVSYYLLDDYLLVSAASSRASVSNQTWITLASAGTGNSNLTTNWVTNPPFKGCTAYTNQNYVTIQSGRNLVYRIKNCKSVKIFGKNNSTSKYLSTKIFEVANGTAATTPAFTLEYTTDANTHVWSQTLDPTKEYVVDIEGVGNSNSQVYELAFERNVEVDPRQEPQLRLSATEFTAHVGDTEFAEPTVYSDGGYTGSYTYSSDKPTVADVNETTGKVTIGMIAGKATITVAVPADDETYRPREITYTITVLKVAPSGAVFYESFDQFDGQGGNDGKWSGITVTPAVGTYDNDGWTATTKTYSGSMCARIGSDSKKLGFTTPAIGIVGAGEVHFEAESWGSDGSNFFVAIVGDGEFVSGGNEDFINSTKDTAKVIMNKSGKWKTFTLKFKGVTASTKLSFHAPAGKRAFLDEVAIWEYPTSYTVNFNNSWASFCAGVKTELPDGVVAYKGAVNGSVLNLTPVNGNVIPANEGVMLKSTTASATLTATDEAAADFTGNQLKGTTTVTFAPANAYCYSKSQNAFAPVATNFSIPANKAYLVLGAGAPSRISIVENVATSVENNALNTEVKKVIVNGQMMIIRGGNMFDLNGRLVK